METLEANDHLLKHLLLISSGGLVYHFAEELFFLQVQEVVQPLQKTPTNVKNDT